MARKKKSQRRKPGPRTTDTVSMRMPRDLHQRLKDQAKAERVTKSRKIVELLTDGLGPAESVFE